MRTHLSVILVFVLFTLQARCQTVQDEWTAPAAPDGSTPLQSGTKFTLLWKPTLQNNFKNYCPSCDTSKLDLWITNFNGTKYISKIGRGIDLTTATSYDWNVNIASTAFSEDAFWVFRFTFFDSVDPYTQQISSPGFKINGLVKASSTVTIQSSSSAFPTSASSNLITMSTSIASSSSSSSSGAPQPTEQTPTPDSSSESSTWIAGVVAGPIVGIAVGAALMWYCLRKRKNQKTQESQRNVRSDQGRYLSQHTPAQDAKEIYSRTVTSVSQPWQQPHHDRYVAEVPGTAGPTSPVELWQGNYRS